MKYFLFLLILAVEAFALANRGGGPLLAHLFLTGMTFGSLLLCFILRVPFRFRFGLTEVSYIIFLALFGVSIITGLTPDFGLNELLLFANGGLLLFLFSGLEFTRRQLHWFSVGLISLALADTLIGFFIYTQTPFPRFAGTFIDLAAPYTSFGNDFANFLLLILPISAWQFFKRHERRTTTLLSGLTFAILLSGFLLSFSRGVWLSAFTVLLLVVIWAVIKKNSKDFLWKIFAMRLLGVLLVTVLLVSSLQSLRAQEFQTNSFFKKVTMSADEGSASASERIQFWKGAVKIMGDHPFLGAGVLSFKYLYPRYQERFGVNWDHPHNLFLKIGVENGTPSAVVFVLFLIGAAIVLLGFFWRNPWHPVLFFVLGSLGAFGHNLVDYNFIVANFTLFMVFIGFGLSFARQEKSSKISWLPLSILTIISFCFLMLGFHEAFYNIPFKRGRAELANKEYQRAAELLEKSQKLFFDRDLATYLSRAYLAQYEKTKDPLWRNKGRDMLLVQAPKSVDAELSSRLGDIYLEDKAYLQAEEQYEKALELDPQNNFKYYFDVLSLQQLLRKPLDAALREKILALLAEYKTALRENRHVTIITKNPLYASKLYEFLKMPKEQKEIDAIWFEELLKFAALYGPIPTP
ncbi:MAG: O-antigen ligase family protein [Patescibacteria group bacterium]